MIRKELFGTTPAGEEVYKFTLSDGGSFEVDIITYGASVVGMRQKDKSGEIVDVVLAHNSLQGFLDSKGYLGASVGRVANRIKGAQFTLDGVLYELPSNWLDNKITIHGGTKGFSHYVWAVEATSTPNELTLTHASGHLDMGFPGNVKVTVTYRVEGDTLHIRYGVTTDARTPVNLTNHAYFNLGGHNAGKPALSDHECQVFADNFLQPDESSVADKVTPVDSTIFDLRSSKRLGDLIDLVSTGMGFDHSFCTDKNDGIALVAKVRHPGTGLCLETRTDQPSVHLYTGYYNDFKDGKNGSTYGQFSAFCLEAQNWPNAPNREDFPSCILSPGENYENNISFKLFVQ